MPKSADTTFKTELFPLLLRGQGSSCVSIKPLKRMLTELNDTTKTVPFSSTIPKSVLTPDVHIPPEKASLHCSRPPFILVSAVSQQDSCLRAHKISPKGLDMNSAMAAYTTRSFFSSLLRTVHNLKYLSDERVVAGRTDH